jgi:hypothetical protein
MSNNEQPIEFPVALKSLLTDFVVDVLRNQVPSENLSTYAAQYFSERQNIQPSTIDEGETGVFLTNQTNGISDSNEPQRRKSVWGGSPV